MWSYGFGGFTIERAAADIANAVADDPLNPWALGMLSMILNMQGRQEDSVAAARRAVEIDPGRLLRRIQPAPQPDVRGAERGGARARAGSSPRHRPPDLVPGCVRGGERGRGAPRGRACAARRARGALALGVCFAGMAGIGRGQRGAGRPGARARPARRRAARPVRPARAGDAVLGADARAAGVRGDRLSLRFLPAGKRAGSVPVPGCGTEPDPEPCHAQDPGPSAPVRPRRSLSRGPTPRPSRARLDARNVNICPPGIQRVAREPGGFLMLRLRGRADLVERYQAYALDSRPDTSGRSAFPDAWRFDPAGCQGATWGNLYDHPPPAESDCGS